MRIQFITYLNRYLFRAFLLACLKLVLLPTATLAADACDISKICSSKGSAKETCVIDKAYKFKTNDGCVLDFENSKYKNVEITKAGSLEDNDGSGRGSIDMYLPGNLTISGKMTANKTGLLLDAGGDVVLNNSALLRSGGWGDIYLTSQGIMKLGGGTISTAADDGGSIELVSKKTLESNALLDVSGKSDGGTILVRVAGDAKFSERLNANGGGFVDIRTSDDGNVKLTADRITANGPDGGDIMVRASGDIEVDSDIETIGNNGYGGAIELTAKGNVIVNSKLSVNGDSTSDGGTIEIKSSGNGDLEIADTAVLTAKGGDFDGNFLIGPACHIYVAGKLQANQGGWAIGSITYREAFVLDDIGQIVLGKDLMKFFMACRENDTGNACAEEPVLNGVLSVADFDGATPEKLEECPFSSKKDDDPPTPPSSSGPYQCGTKSCDDGNHCTIDSCSGGKCSHKLISTYDLPHMATCNVWNGLDRIELELENSSNTTCSKKCKKRLKKARAKLRSIERLIQTFQFKASNGQCSDKRLKKHRKKLDNYKAFLNNNKTTSKVPAPIRKYLLDEREKADWRAEELNRMYCNPWPAKN